MSQTTSHPRRLQVNINGAWKNVVPFALGGEAMERVKSAVQALHEVSPCTAWRIVTASNPPKVLGYLGRNTYGLWVMRGEGA